LSSKVENIFQSRFSEAESKKIVEFARFANCGSKPLSKTCKECMSPKDGFKMFFFYQFSRMKKFHYKFFIHYNDSAKLVVLSFGAPSVENHKYVTRIYSRGWSIIKMYQVKVEREFKIVYFSKLRKILTEKVEKIKKSGRVGYRFIFTGYSLGGSLAVLSAFDLVRQNVMNKIKNQLTVYTYGGLRIGDASFVAMINSTFTLWRIVKQSDFIVRIPNCYYSAGVRLWRCFSQPVLKKFIVSRRFPLRFYIRRYINTGNRGPLGRLQIYANQRIQAPPVQYPKHHSPLVRHTQNLLKARNSQHTQHSNNVQHLQNLQRLHQFNRSKLEYPRFMEVSSSSKSSKQFFTRPQPTRWVSPTIVPRTKIIRTNLVQSYYKYIYYTQPVGREIFYNNSMTIYKPCVYISGISSCEKSVTLPTSFSSAAHKVYYGVNFDKCK